MRSLSRSSLPPSPLPAASLFCRLLLAQPLFLPPVPSNRTSLSIPTIRRRVGRAASRCFSAHRAFLSLSLSLFLSLSLPPSPFSLHLPWFYPSRYTCTSGPRRERLARNPPQNKRVPRRVAAVAAQRPRLPFRVFLTIDSLPSPSAKLPADTVRKERGSRTHEEMRLLSPGDPASYSSISVGISFEPRGGEWGKLRDSLNVGINNTFLRDRLESSRRRLSVIFTS